MKHIYLDYNATTPVAPTVIEAMQPFFSTHYGNPSSTHVMGRAAAEAIEDARVQVAHMVGAHREEIVFTSGGTESNNLALIGTHLTNLEEKGHLITSSIEHPAIAAPARFLQRLGYDLTVISCDQNGLVSPDDVRAAIRPNTRLISIMHSNNETGVIQPISEISRMCRSEQVLIHTDASQSCGKVPLSINELGVDLLTIAGHKMYAPKGIGALYVREGLHLHPVLHGADQEHGMRPGTENTPYIVGLGEAAARASKAVDQAAEHMQRLRDRLYDRMQSQLDTELHVNGRHAERLPNTLSVIFPGVAGYALIDAIPEICASTGAACHSQTVDMSTTLRAMALSPEEAAGTVRLSLGWYSSEEEIDRAANLMVDAYEKMASTSPGLS